MLPNEQPPPTTTCTNQCNGRPTPASIVRDELVRSPVAESTVTQQKLTPSQFASPLVAKTPISRIPIRTANAEKRARANNCLPPEYDESKLSPSEIRALRAQKRAAWRQARLKSLENDALQAQIMIQTMNAAMLHEDGTAGGGVGTNANNAAGKMTSVPQRRNGTPTVEAEPGTTDDIQDERDGGGGDDGHRWAGRFPRLAVKSRPGSEVVVRETEKVVEEKVTRRTEEVPGGGLRTVEYIEKVIETEVETMREKIIMFELEDSSSGDSERVDEHDGLTTTTSTASGAEELPSDEARVDEETAPPCVEESSSTVQTIVEVINPMLTGDGQPHDIAIGRYNDVYGGEDSFAFASSDSPSSGTAGARFSYEPTGTYESINDKMKHVLRELKQCEKLAYEQQHQKKYQQQQQMPDDDAVDDGGEEDEEDSYRDCEVITNPNAEGFAVDFDTREAGKKLFQQTIHSEKLKAAFGRGEDDGDDDEEEGEKSDAGDDRRNGNTPVTPAVSASSSTVATMSTTSATTTTTMVTEAVMHSEVTVEKSEQVESSTGSGLNGSGKRKKRKGKKKK
ncbi:AGAP000055-PA-like protein [Anopheles sinensis]|uniref:AGAP000055-PA-like protein n=1 Tax=Anopheles sinensis TaxID=74873 RepID=A0A084WPT3_ANOSI|nr:AGAP000055-PA-like protein [Anopheles sinensis]